MALPRFDALHLRSRLLALVVSLLLGACTVRGGLMKVTIYDSFGAPDFNTFGTDYTHRVGELSLDQLFFTDWRPFGLTEFAATIEGTLRITVPGYYNQWYQTFGGFYLSQGFDLTFHQAYMPDGSISYQHVNETYMEGFMDFKIYFQTDSDPATKNDFLWSTPSPWGGDPRVHDPAARAYLWVPDNSATFGLLGLSMAGLLALRRRLRA